MSLPNHTSPPLSSSSSKQSIRGTLGSTAPSRPRPIDRPTAQQSETAFEQHSHAIAENTASHYEEEAIHDNIPQTSQSFQPFFTLIEDGTTSEYHHPTVHYIFSDDDTDIVTEAALRSVDNVQDNPNTTKDPLRSTPNQQQGEHEDELADSGKESLLPPPIPGIRDNYIILDVEPTNPEGPEKPVPNPNPAVDTRSISTSPATQPLPQHPPPQFKVTSSQSLTPTWQVLNTELVPAPTFENNPSGEQPSNGGLMLKIHGTAGLPPSISGKDKEKEKGSQRLEDMMDQFAKRMSELRQIIEAGGQSREMGEQITTDAPITGDTGQDIQVEPQGEPTDLREAGQVGSSEDQPKETTV